MLLKNFVISYVINFGTWQRRCCPHLGLVVSVLAAYTGTTVSNHSYLIKNPSVCSSLIATVLLPLSAHASDSSLALDCCMHCQVFVCMYELELVGISSGSWYHCLPIRTCL